MSQELRDRVAYIRDKKRYIDACPAMGWEEKACINLYTEHISHLLNTYLRTKLLTNGYDDKTLELYSYHISSGLSNTYEKFRQRAYRGLALDNAEIDQFQQALDNGTTIVFKHFSSSTISPGVADTFADRASKQKNKTFVILMIDSNTGVDITQLAMYPDESEILFDKEIEVRVLRIIRENGKRFIRLKEV